MCEENVFYDILEPKNLFVAYKNKKLKNSKNWNFSWKVRTWLLLEIGHFSFFLF